MSNFEVIPFEGREGNVRLRCNDAEMIVTLDVGPRILSYGKVGGPNMLFVSRGNDGIGDFLLYGGHRVWIAPEEAERTLQPDNDPVEFEQLGDEFVFTSLPDKYHTQKELRVLVDPVQGRFVVKHRVYNHSPYPLELAVWVLTQFASGETIIPQPPYIAHTEYVVAARPLVLWHFTDLTDSRLSLGKRVIRLRHDPKLGPQKIGALVQQGYGATAAEGSVLFKRFEFDPTARFTDHGCNYETFTRQDILEMETLGAFAPVPSGGYAEHQETWYLVPDVVPPAGDEACGDWLEEIAASRPL